MAQRVITPLLRTPVVPRLRRNSSILDWYFATGGRGAGAFYFRPHSEPMPDGGCGVLVQHGATIGVLIDGCRWVVTYGGSNQPCFNKNALALVLGLEPDRSSCEVTEADAEAVVAKWGKPWVVTVLPPESEP